DSEIRGHIEHASGDRDTFAVHDVEFGLAERRGDLVLDHLHTGADTDGVLAVLDRLDTADIHAHRGVELQRVTAGGRLRAAEYDADLHAQLVDEDDAGVRPTDRAGQLPERLAHEPGLET